MDSCFLVRHWRMVIIVASPDMAISFNFSCALAHGLYNQFQNEPNIVNINFATFGLSTTIDITALSVLCRILLSLNLLDSNVGVVTLVPGIAHDSIGECCLPSVSSL